MIGHGEPHLRGDVHVDVLIQPLPAPGDEVVEAHELLHERVDRALVADHVHGVTECRTKHHGLGQLALLHEAFVGELLRTDPAKLVGGRVPDAVPDLAGDVTEEHGLVRRADVAAAVVARLGQPVEGLVGEIDRLRRQRLRSLHPQSDDRERPEPQEVRRRLRVVRHPVAQELDERRQRRAVHEAVAGDARFGRMNRRVRVPGGLGARGELAELSVIVGGRHLAVAHPQDAVAVDVDPGDERAGADLVLG